MCFRAFTHTMAHADTDIRTKTKKINKRKKYVENLKKGYHSRLI